MTEIEFKLKKKNITKTDDKEDTEKLTFIPIDNEKAKKLKFEFSQKVKDKLVKEIGLPTTIGDTVVIDFGITNKQTNLDESKKQKKREE